MLSKGSNSTDCLGSIGCGSGRLHKLNLLKGCSLSLVVSLALELPPGTHQLGLGEVCWHGRHINVSKMAVFRTQFDILTHLRHHIVRRVVYTGTSDVIASLSPMGCRILYSM